MLLNIGIPTLSFQTLEFLPYPFKHCNSYVIFLNVGILTLSFHTREFLPYPFKHLISHLIL